MEPWEAVVTIIAFGLLLMAMTAVCAIRLTVNIREFMAARRHKLNNPSGSSYNYIPYLGPSRLQLITQAAAPRGFPTPALVNSKEECFAYLERSREIANGWLLGKEAVTLLAASAAGAAVGAALTDYESKGWKNLLQQTGPDYFLVFFSAIILLTLALAFQETRLTRWRQMTNAYGQRLDELP